MMHVWSSSARQTRLLRRQQDRRRAPTASEDETTSSEVEDLVRQRTSVWLVVLSVAGWFVPSASAQAPLPMPVQSPSSYPMAAIERIVSPISLYPDPLPAQALAAATFPRH